MVAAFPAVGYEYADDGSDDLGAAAPALALVAKTPDA
jgi:hypothetical protein